MGKPEVKKMKAKKDIEGLIKALKNKDGDVRKEAAEALGKMRGARAVERLIQALEDGDKYVRGEAAEALAKIGGKRAAEALAQVRKSPTYWVYMSPLGLAFEFSKQPALSWPPYCCICLEPIGPSDFYEIRGEDVFMDAVATCSAEVKLKIPYCNNCRRKVKKLFGGESEGVSIEVFMVFVGTAPSIGGITLRFRNPLYAKMFWEANKDLGPLFHCSTGLT